MAEGDERRLYRVDVVSDTHGSLSDALLEQLQGADLIVHAGDFTSVANYQTLCKIARLEACEGNNDYMYDYGPAVKRRVQFTYLGLRFQLSHYEERLDLAVCDIAVCGHTHRPWVRWERGGRVLMMNPGSPTLPRTSEGPTMGRIWIREPERSGGTGTIESAEIVSLVPEGEEWSPWARFFKK